MADTLRQAADSAREAGGAVESLADVTVLFALVLALALLIERAIEVLKSGYDVIDSKGNFCNFWTRRAKGVARRLELRVRVFEYVPLDRIGPILNRVYEMLLNTQGGYSGNALIISGDLVRVAAIRVGTKILGIAMGVALAFALKINFLTLWMLSFHRAIAQYTSQKVTWQPSDTLLILASGIAMGLGASPVHKLITTLEKKQSEREEEKKENDE